MIPERADGARRPAPPLMMSSGFLVLGVVLFFAFSIVFAGCAITGDRDHDWEFFEGMIGPPYTMPSLNGLSGLAKSPEGQLWAASEGGELIRLGQHGEVGPKARIRELDPSFEIEALTFLANGDFVLGTEVDRERSSDVILLARASADGDELEIYRHLLFDYSLWDISPPPDQGVEGICNTGTAILAVSEATEVRGETRYAPLGSWDIASGRWDAYWIELSSETGKLAGLTCRTSAHGVEFVAIERDFGVAHILHGSLTGASGGGADEKTIRPDLVLDWSGIAQNLEGVAWIDRDRLYVLDDNYYKSSKSGSSRLWTVMSEALSQTDRSEFAPAAPHVP